MVRDNWIYLLVGKRGCGKTTTAIRLARKIGNPIMVINTDNNDAYKDFEIVPLSKLYQWKGKEGICITDDPLEALRIVNLHLLNTFIICDDTQKYIRGSVHEKAIKFIINHRMRNFDVVFMYHALKFVPPYLSDQFNQIVLFKTLDSNMSDLKNRFNNADTLIKKMAEIKAHPSPYYCDVINDTDE